MEAQKHPTLVTMMAVQVMGTMILVQVIGTMNVYKGVMIYGVQPQLQNSYRSVGVEAVTMPGLLPFFRC